MSTSDRPAKRGRPPGRDYPIQARINLSAELQEQLRRLAKRADCSQSELVRRLIAQASERAK